MKPSIYRSYSSSQVDGPLDTFLDHFRNRSQIDLRPVYRPSTEPVLQHYGIKTRWLDLVDSVLHAVFFAVHSVESAVDPDGVSWLSHVQSSDEFGFIYLLDCGTERELKALQVLEDMIIKDVSGVWMASDGFQLCDLRRAKPSKALRLHSQHGLLCRLAPG
jgi:hypothetical protein